MSTTIKTLSVIAILMLLSAVIVWEYAHHVFRRHRWIVLEQPVHFDEGFSFSRPFSVDLATSYEIKLFCNKTIPWEILDSALMHNLAAEFSVTADGTTISHGDTSELLGQSGMNDQVARFICTFEAEPSVAYKLDFRIERSLPQLAATNPLINVSVNGRTFTQAWEKRALPSYVALILGVVGLLCGLPVLVSLRMRFLRRRSRTT